MRLEINSKAYFYAMCIVELSYDSQTYASGPFLGLESSQKSNFELQIVGHMLVSKIQITLLLR